MEGKEIEIIGSDKSEQVTNVPTMETYYQGFYFDEGKGCFLPILLGYDKDPRNKQHTVDALKSYGWSKNLIMKMEMPAHLPELLID